MVQKSILAVALIGVLVWTITCGRSRTPQPSDTPVPTLTALATATAVPTQTPTAMPTEVPTATPTVVEVTPEAAVGEAMTATDAITTTEVVTESARVSESSAITEVVSITASTSVSEAETIAATVEATATEKPTATAQATVTTTPTSEPTATEEPSATATQATVTTTPTPEPTATEEPSATATQAAATSTPQPTATEEATETPTVEATTAVPEAATVEPSATPTVGATAAVTASVALSETASVSETSVLTETGVLTGSEVTASTPNVDVTVEAQPLITLPTDLATSVQISGVTLLTELVENVLPSVAELSPDGTKVAWLVAEQARRLATLCIADITGGGQNCFTVEGYQGLPYHLVWSPDGQWLAFSEDPSAQALESDIWLFDVANEEITNRTDDQTVGHYAEAVGDFALDYLPMWNPATGALYFWRSTPDGAGGFALELMQLDPAAAGEAQVVSALGQSLGDGVVRFGWQRFYLLGPSAMSPDGTQVAVSIAPAQEMDLSSSDALWLIDLTNADAEPRQVATAFAWQGALPQWANQPAVARGLQWGADGKGIVVAALSSDLRLPLLLAYYVDVESGDVMPVVDFSDSRERDAFFRLDPTSGHAPRFDVPWTLALAPTANVLLMVTDLAGGVRILGSSLPPTGESPVVLFEQSSPGYEVWTRSSSAVNGTILVYGLLLESMPLELTPD